MAGQAMVVQFHNNQQHVIPNGVASMFLLDQRDFRSTFAVYLAREPAIRNVAVPGDHRFCLVDSDTARDGTAAVAYWFSDLHLRNFTIAGPLVMDDFCITHSGALKGTNTLFHKLVPLAVAAVGLPQGLVQRVDMAMVARFIRQNIYGLPPVAPVQVVNGVAVPVPHPVPVVDDLLKFLNDFHPNVPNIYLALKSHPGLHDAIGKATLSKNLYGILRSMKAKSNANYQAAHNFIEASIPNHNWLCSGVQNIFIHQVLRYSGPAPTPVFGRQRLHSLITKFLSSSFNIPSISNVGTGELCLSVNRNAESHLKQDYCGTAQHVGTEEGMRAAIAALVVKQPLLAMALPYPQGQALRNIFRCHFSVPEAESIATAIVDALSKNVNSSFVAQAAATEAARYLARERVIYRFTEPQFKGQQAAAAAAAVRAGGAAAARQPQPPHPLEEKRYVQPKGHLQHVYSNGAQNDMYTPQGHFRFRRTWKLGVSF